MRAPTFVCVTTIVTLAAASTIAIAADRFRKLDEVEIKAKLAGMEITDDIHWTEQYMRDGSYKSWFMGGKRNGKWHADKGQLCIEDGSQDAGCKEVWMNGNKVEFHFVSGRVLEGILQKQQQRG